MTNSQEKRAQLEKELADRANAVMAAVIKGLEAKGHVVEVWTHDSRWGHEYKRIALVDAHFLEVDMRIEETTKDTYTCKPTGRLRMSIPTPHEYEIGKTKSYPEPKKGFVIAKAVERIEETLAMYTRRRASEVAKETFEKSARATFVQACKIAGFDDPSTYSDYSIKDRVSIHRLNEQEVSVKFPIDPAKLGAVMEFIEGLNK